MVLAFGVLALLGIVGFYLSTKTVAVLSPRGPIAAQEKHLIIIAVLLMLIVVIPIFVLLGVISWRYRASNTKARYSPDWEHNRAYEAIWWTVPLLLIISLSVLAWQNTHRLDPTRTISSVNKPIRVEAVALRWKWMFIYPDLGVASVNYMQFPTDTPLDFKITSDGAMNSLWIPQLGGQIYAMAGMSTQLHLLADQPGSYRGVSANISGKGFAGMHFEANATSRSEFDKWLVHAQSAQPLTMTTYAALAQPSQYNSPATYSLQAQGLYDTILEKFTGPSGAMHGMNTEHMKMKH